MRTVLSVLSQLLLFLVTMATNLPLTCNGGMWLLLFLSFTFLLRFLHRSPLSGILFLCQLLQWFDYRVNLNAKKW